MYFFQEQLIAVLTRCINYLFSSGAPDDQKILLDHGFEEVVKNQSLQHSGAGRSSKMKELRICYKHPIILKIFQSLNLEGALEQRKVQTTFDEDELSIKGPMDIILKLKTILITEDNEVIKHFSSVFNEHL